MSTCSPSASSVAPAFSWNVTLAYGKNPFTHRCCAFAAYDAVPATLVEIIVTLPEEASSAFVLPAGKSGS